jgi:hypothetical protein
LEPFRGCNWNRANLFSRRFAVVRQRPITATVCERVGYSAAPLSNFDKSSVRNQDACHARTSDP